jgi:RimJ/RimL family protein N-acetyltransferase
VTDAVIETERLLLRKPTESDVADPPAFLSDPRVMDFLGGVGDPQWVVRSWVDG